MLYELIAVVRPGNITNVKECVPPPTSPYNKLYYDDTNKSYYHPFSLALCSIQKRSTKLTFKNRICRVAGTHILNHNGVIRGITNWGEFQLPRPTVKHQTQHHKGHYFIMQFDSSIRAQEEVRRTMGLDPRMIRFSVVKIGDKLGGKEGYGSIENVTGEIPWNRNGSRPPAPDGDLTAGFLSNTR